MATSKELDNLKSEMKDANESLKEKEDAIVIKSVAENKISDAEQPVKQNAPRPSQDVGLIGEIHNKSIQAQSNGKHGLSAELQNILSHLGELKSKIAELERNFVDECEDLINKLKDKFK